MGTQVSIDLDAKKDVWSTQILCFVDIGYWEQTASRIYLTRFPTTDFAESRTFSFMNILGNLLPSYKKW